MKEIFREEFEKYRKKKQEKEQKEIGDLVIQEKDVFTGRLRIDVKNMPLEYIELYNDIKTIYHYDKDVMINLLKVFVKYEYEQLINKLQERIEKIKSCLLYTSPSPRDS